MVQLTFYSWEYFNENVKAITEQTSDLNERISAYVNVIHVAIYNGWT